MTLGRKKTVTISDLSDALEKMSHGNASTTHVPEHHSSDPIISNDFGCRMNAEEFCDVGLSIPTDTGEESCDVGSHIAVFWFDSENLDQAPKWYL